MQFKSVGGKQVNPPAERNIFNEGELLPIKGVWFRVKRVDAKELVLEPRSFTKSMKDKIEAGRVVETAPADVE
jgi:hypothetical protein